MRKIILVMALAATALGVSACGTTGTIASVPPPAVVADKTALDEQAATGAELAYKGFRLAAEFGVDAGIIKGDTAGQVQAIDRQAFAALAVVRAAYDAGNAQDYASAILAAHEVIAKGIALAKGGAT